MLFVIDYKIKPTVTRDGNRQIMELFAKEPQSPGELSHHARLDGSGGYVLLDSDDVTALYSRVLMFEEFMEFSVIPVLPIEEAVGPILKSLED
jgi:hypothetical protein